MSINKIVVTTVTKRGYKYLPNIINNFTRQLYPHKKLVIIFNSDDIEKEIVAEKLKENGITDFYIEIFPDKTQGYCLNHSIQQIPEDFNIWTKMDDDDYYGKNYLMTNLEAMLYSKADIVGRSDMYIYVPKWNKLFFRKDKGNNQYVKWVAGASLFVKKHVFNKAMFPDEKAGVDVGFGNVATRHRFTVFAAPVNDFVVIRRINNYDHTWKINLNGYLRNSKMVNVNLFEGRKNHIF